jgi:hypothetical protein
MIGRIFKGGRSFRESCHYVAQDQTRAHVLYQEGVRGYDDRLMARDFEMIHALHPERLSPVFHAVLDFHRDERLDETRMVEIARKYLHEIGMINTQYVIVQHTDTPHNHLHLVANRIDYNGNWISDSHDLLKNKYAVEKLVQEYDLVPPPQSKNLRQTNFDVLNASDTRRYAIYRSIKECLPDCRNLPELEQQLKQMDIEVQYRLDQHTGQKIGISFRYQQEAFKGSTIDKECSLRQLEKRLCQRQELTQWESEKLALRVEQIQKEEQTLRQQQEQRQRQEQTPKMSQEQESDRRRQRQRQVPRQRIH